MKKTIMLSILLTLGLNASIQNKVNIESVSHKNRINILQTAENCIQNVKNKEEYNKCERTEKEMRKNNKKEIFQLKKENILNKIDTKILNVNNKKECINTSNNLDELKKCKNNKNQGK